QGPPFQCHGTVPQAPATTSHAPTYEGTWFCFFHKDIYTADEAVLCAPESILPAVTLRKT
ncbi:hypothetical protein, partial [Acinetobacter baumannii]|uniref:hypothetical protein n=1 Tax=Acinetobacter baumannii TaxID=470 RepID=UPI00148997BE